MTYKSGKIIKRNGESRVSDRPLGLILMGTEFIWLKVPMSKEIISRVYLVAVAEISCYAP